MIELKANLWDLLVDKNKIPVITTNGSLAFNGSAVMGRGVAFEAAQKWPYLPEILGRRIKEEGNRVHIINPEMGTMLIAFPVKRQYFMRADLDLIATSTHELRQIAQIEPKVTFYLPRPGCGNGKRDWQEIKPIVECLPDNVIIVSL